MIPLARMTVCLINGALRHLGRVPVRFPHAVYRRRSRFVRDEKHRGGFGLSRLARNAAFGTGHHGRRCLQQKGDSTGVQIRLVPDTAGARECRRG